MEKITGEMIKEKKAQIIAIAVLFIGCIYVFFFMNKDTNPPPKPPVAQQPEAAPAAPAGPRPANQPAPPPEPPPAKKVFTGAS